MPSNWAEWTVESEQNDSSSFFALYRALLAERHASTVHSAQLLGMESQVFAFVDHP
jgi:hypothetical protein